MLHLDIILINMLLVVDKPSYIFVYMIVMVSFFLLIFVMIIFHLSFEVDGNVGSRMTMMNKNKSLPIKTPTLATFKEK